MIREVTLKAEKRWESKRISRSIHIAVFLVFYACGCQSANPGAHLENTPRATDGQKTASEKPTSTSAGDQSLHRQMGSMLEDDQERAEANPPPPAKSRPPDDPITPRRNPMSRRRNP